MGVSFGRGGIKSNYALLHVAVDEWLRARFAANTSGAGLFLKFRRCLCTHTGKGGGSICVLVDFILDVPPQDIPAAIR